MNDFYYPFTQDNYIEFLRQETKDKDPDEVMATAVATALGTLCVFVVGIIIAGVCSAFIS